MTRATTPMTMANNSSPCAAVTVWALLASVLLNLFLVGVVMGVGHHHGHHRSFGPMALEEPHGDYLVGWIMRYLDPQDAEIFRAAFKTEEANLKQAHSHMHKATAEIATAFAQNPADPTALKTAQTHLAEARNETSEIVNRIVQSAYTKLSPEGRQRIATMTQAPM